MIRVAQGDLTGLEKKIRVVRTELEQEERRKNQAFL